MRQSPRSSGKSSRREIGTFLVAAVVVPVIVVFGVLIRFFLPLGVIVGFWFANDDASLVSVLVAAGCCLAVLACVGFGVEMPLSRRWGLPITGATPTTWSRFDC